MQYDILVLLSRRSHPTWHPGRRRRTRLNPFHQVPEQDPSPGNHLYEAKRFKEVRYRPECSTSTAEMKSPKYKNKVSFGEFKCQAQAARGIDAAFHYYGKPHLLIFSDAPGILSTGSSPAEVFNQKDKLRFVKEQASEAAGIHGLYTPLRDFRVPIQRLHWGHFTVSLIL